MCGNYSGAAIASWSMTGPLGHGISLHLRHEVCAIEQLIAFCDAEREVRNVLLPATRSYPE